MDELAFLSALHRPGTVIDVGAHDGALAIPLARLAGASVIAFEPLPAAFARLSAAVHEAGVAVQLRSEALGAGAGRAVLEVPSVAGVAQEQWASLAKDYATIAAGDARVDAVARTEVAVIALDSLDLADVTAIKVDAEGFEEEVLRGAAATLARCRPVLSVEIEERHRRGSTARVPAFLAGLGYAGYFHLDGAWLPIAAFDAARMQGASPSPASYEVSDPYVLVFFFVPDERLAEMAALAPFAA